MLVCAIERYTRARRSCAIIKHGTDTRFGETCEIRTHAGRVFDSVPIIYATSLDDEVVARIIDEHEIIGIDEIQFFALFDESRARNIARIIDGWVARGKIIICSGLDSDYRREPFSVIAPLISLSNNVTKLLAVCTRCGADAMFSARIVADSRAYTNPVGGSEKYVALCRACYCASVPY